jgi:hypothetical protein
MSSQGNSDVTTALERVVASPDSACTPVCTKPVQADTVTALAAVLLGLSPQDRARLAAALLRGETANRTDSGN